MHIIIWLPSLLQINCSLIYVSIFQAFIMNRSSSFTELYFDSILNLFSWLVWYLDNLQSQISFGCHHLPTVFKLWVSKYQLYQRMTRLTVYCILSDRTVPSSIRLQMHELWIFKWTWTKPLKNNKNHLKNYLGKSSNRSVRGNFWYQGDCSLTTFAMMMLWFHLM